MKKCLSQPHIRRIISECVLSGVFIFLMLGLIMPFDIDEIKEGLFGFLVTVALITSLCDLIVHLFTAYVLHMPPDPRLPVNVLRRYSLIRIVIAVPLLAAALVTFWGWYFGGHILWGWQLDGEFSLKYYSYYLYYVSAVSVFMFIGSYFRDRSSHLSYELEEVRAINSMLEQRQQAMAEKEEMKVQQQEDAEANTSKDTSQEVILQSATASDIFEVSASDIIYIESMANYADICYMENDEPKHKTMRITLKSIRESMDNVPQMVQCHRAFIVNLNFVVSMSNRSSGLQLQLFGTDKQIPVSRSFTPVVREKLQAGV